MEELFASISNTNHFRNASEFAVVSLLLLSRRGCARDERKFEPVLGDGFSETPF